MIEKNDKAVRLTDQDPILGGLLAREIPGGHDMNECPTLETLSEFIDNKLAHDARERVVAHLGDCSTCCSVVSDSLTIREEMLSRSRARTRKYFIYSLPAGLAAAAVMLLAFRIMQPAPIIREQPEQSSTNQRAQIAKTSPTRPNTAVIPRSLADELTGRLTENNNAASFTPAADDQSRRRTAFGFSATVPLEKAAFRIGVCLTDLEVALKTNDKGNIELFAKKLIELLKPMEASYGLIPSIIEQRKSTGNPVKEEHRYEGFSRAVEALFENKKEAVYLKFGAWIEAAGLAAQARDVSFFRPAEIMGFKKELEQRDVPIGTLKDLSNLESIISTGKIQTDQFKVVTRLLADIKEMF